MGEPFEIYPYSIERLTSILVEKSISNTDIIENKLHLLYFQEYFQHLETKTILVENDYIDKDFLEDYASYYVRCFSEYKRKCTRLHFFKKEFDLEDFNSLLNKKDQTLSEKLQQDYLGFIVVKPLPLTIIGRTCLTTYPQEEGEERYFPITRKYDVHLFGLHLLVDSLGFQEQDNVVAACATSTLWSVFHQTGILFHHSILSPVEITKAATKQLPIETRTFPNKGLSSEQMAQAIRGVSLEPLLVEVKNDEYYLKSYLYAYLRSGIPVIFGIELFGIRDNRYKLIGRHAAAVAGYRLHGKRTTGVVEKDVQLVSSKISKIYVHDDQVGPFSRMVFDSPKIEVTENGEEKNLVALSTSWKTGEYPIGSVKAVPKILLIPMYHKIRISFDVIHKTIRVFNSILEELKENIAALPYERFCWDIYLTDVNKLKSEILDSKALKGNYYRGILLGNMPRFIWRATAIQGDSPVIDLLFDATDIEQGRYFILPIEYKKSFSDLLRWLFKEDFFGKIPRNNPAWEIIHWFRKNKERNTVS
ncbi:MAG: hypothetical protein KAW12_18955 [Candidatus Aminicenantes bacterium]|nr:hypothetical protein [Candidatus Aminicenantes bacterium]